MISIRESNRLCAHDVVVYNAFLEGGVLVTQYSPLEFPLERRKYEMILIHFADYVASVTAVMDGIEVSVADGLKSCR